MSAPGDRNHLSAASAAASDRVAVTVPVPVANGKRSPSMQLEVPGAARPDRAAAEAGPSAVELRRQSTNGAAAGLNGSIGDSRKSISTRGGGNGNGNARTKSAATTVALLCISFYYVFTTLSISVVEFVQGRVRPGPENTPVADVPRNPTWWFYLAVLGVRTIVVDLAMSHYAIFFYIYLCTSPAFRRVAVCHLAALCPLLFGRLREKNIQREQRRRTTENNFH